MDEIDFDQIEKATVTIASEYNNINHNNNRLLLKNIIQCYNLHVNTKLIYLVPCGSSRPWQHGIYKIFTQFYAE